MTGFTFAAVVMVLAAAAFVVVPFLRGAEREVRSGDSPTMPWGVTAVILLAIPAASLGIYTLNSEWTWHAATEMAPAGSEAQSLEVLIPQMEQRLLANGGSIQDWSMLGRSYLHLGNNQKALWAFGKAYDQGGGSTAQVIANYAQAMVMVDRSTLAGMAGELFEQALEKDPLMPTALFFGGMAAKIANNPDLARTRWTALLETNPPQDVEEIVRLSLAGLGEPGTVAPAAASVPVAAAPAASDGIQLTVDISPDLKGRLNGPAALFIFARNAQGGGPPIAVLRRSSDELPTTVRLTDRDAMLPGTRLMNFDRLKLVARVSLGGTPTAQSGDFFGQVDYSIRDDGPVSLLIDQVVP